MITHNKNTFEPQAYLRVILLITPSEYMFWIYKDKRKTQKYLMT